MTTLDELQQRINENLDAIPDAEREDLLARATGEHDLAAVEKYGARAMSERVALVMAAVDAAGPFAALDLMPIKVVSQLSLGTFMLGYAYGAGERE